MQMTRAKIKLRLMDLTKDCVLLSNRIAHWQRQRKKIQVKTLIYGIKISRCFLIFG
jgi:hypothetical protein